MIIRTLDDVTADALAAMNSTEDSRLRDIMASLVKHLHAFVRDVRLTEPEFRQAASILNHHLDVFDRVSEEAYEFESQQSEVSEEQNKLRKLLNMSVNEIELSVRAANCLNNANITTVGELAMKTEQEMLKYRNFGKKSLNEIKEKLEALGLSLGMKFDERLLDAKKEA